MSGSKEKREELLTNEQIQERISRAMELGGGQKSQHLIAGMFVVSFLALTLVVSAPDWYRQTAIVWASIHWGINLIWTVVAGVGWWTLPDWESRQLAKEQRCNRLRLQTMWFHFWKGGFLLLCSTLMMLMGLGMIKHLEPAKWVDILAAIGYGLTYVFSFWRKRYLFHVKLKGRPFDKMWKRLLIRLAVIGPAIAAATCSAAMSILARLHIVPISVAAGFFGILSIGVASAIVPQIAYDFIAAWIHRQIRKTEVNQTMTWS
jgi:hypothetical protein